MSLGKRLQSVYACESPKALEGEYDGWAGTYDRDLGIAEYRLPVVAALLICRYAPAGATPMLDVGVGTGLLGSFLAPLGYGGMVGVDLSREMLTRAAERGVYDELVQCDVTRGLPFADERFEVVAAVGVFGLGHLSPEILPELVRVVKLGGSLVFSVSAAAYEAFGFDAAIERIESGGRVDRVDVTRSFPMYPGEPGLAHLTGRCFAYTAVRRVPPAEPGRRTRAALTIAPRGRSPPGGTA